VSEALLTVLFETKPDIQASSRSVDALSPSMRASPSASPLRSLASLLLTGANPVPLVDVVAWGWTLWALLVVYWIEAFGTVLLGVIKALFAERGSPDVVGCGTRCSALDRPVCRRSSRGGVHRRAVRVHCSIPDFEPARTTSSTFVKSRVWVPSPCSSGRRPRARSSANCAITFTYSPSCPSAPSYPETRRRNASAHRREKLTRSSFRSQAGHAVSRPSNPVIQTHVQIR